MTKTTLQSRQPGEADHPDDLSRRPTDPPSIQGVNPWKPIMKKLALAAVVALTLSMGIASAAVVGDGSNLGQLSNRSHWSVGTPGNFDNPNG
jgi:hypothetical protein